MESSPLYYKAAPLSTKEPGPYPALVFLHGRGSNENDLIELAPYLPPQLLVISLRAPHRYKYGGYTWFDLDETFDINIDQLLGSCDAVSRCLDDIKQNYPVDSSRLFLFGFIMGAMMSLVMSLSNPDLFKGIVAHSGILPQHKRLTYKWNELGNLSFFIAHGSYDPVVPVELGRQVHERLIQSNANAVYKEYPIQHTISDESLGDIAGWLQNLI
jgi:phospholipase/carboxylesterase